MNIVFVFVSSFWLCSLASIVYCLCNCWSWYHNHIHFEAFIFFAHCTALELLVSLIVSQTNPTYHLFQHQHLILDNNKFLYSTIFNNNKCLFQTIQRLHGNLSLYTNPMKNYTELFWSAKDTYFVYVCMLVRDCIVYKIVYDEFDTFNACACKILNWQLQVSRYTENYQNMPLVTKLYGLRLKTESVALFGG